MANTLGGYEIIREIARSNDIVYEARDPAMNRRIAVKELALPPNLVGEQRRERIERFYREARAAGNLSHPNIVTIFKVGEDNGRHFIAMEYLEGDTLRNMLQIGGPLPVQRAVEICAQICDALEYAHQRGVVHRDIKPDNIQILPNGTAKLTDFGIARLGNEPGITQAGQVFGTPSYMSPEQIAGKPVDQRSDLFSMGVVLYEILTGRKPFTGDSIVTITYNIMNMDPGPPLGVPPHLQQMIRRAMAKQPEQRYSSARELAEELRRPPPAANPFAAGQQVTNLPRVTSLPGQAPLPPAGSAPGYPPFTVAPPPLPTGAVGQGAPGMGYGNPSAARSSLGTGPLVPTGLAASPMTPAAPPLPPPGPAFESGVREFMVKQGTLLTLIGLAVVFVMIAVGVFWALTAGYQGFQNNALPERQRRENDRVVEMLRGGDFADAKPILDQLESEVKPGTPMFDTVQHNLGTYYLEAGTDAQQRGDLNLAQLDYQEAMTRLPDKRDELQNAISAMQKGQAAPPAPNPEPTPAPAQNAAPSYPSYPSGAGGPSAPPVQNSALPYTGSNPGNSAAAPSAPGSGSPAGATSGGQQAPSTGTSTTAPGVITNGTAGGGTTGASSNGTPGPANDTDAETKQQAYRYYQQGTVAERRGDTATARDDYQEALKMDPGASWAQDAQARFNRVVDQTNPIFGLPSP